MPRTPVRLLMGWVLLFALYLLFAGQASPPEVCAGALAAGAGAALQLYIGRQGDRTLRLAAPWPTLAGRVGASLARDTARVGRALARAIASGAVRGRVQVQPFDPGAEDLPEAAGRRALVMLAASVAPNGFVWRAAGTGTDLLVHRLVPEPPSEDMEWPV